MDQKTIEDGIRKENVVQKISVPNNPEADGVVLVPKGFLEYLCLADGEVPQVKMSMGGILVTSASDNRLDSVPDSTAYVPVSIPRSMLDSFELEDEDEIIVRSAWGAVMLSPFKRVAAAITYRRNRAEAREERESFDWGPPVGREML